MKATEIRKGMILKVNSDPHRVLAMQHITPGNWRGMVQTKLRNLRSGANAEIRFRSEDEVEKMMLDTKQMQYLYHDQHGYHFMDTETYDQIALADDDLGEAMSYVVPEAMISMEWIEGKPAGIDLPSSVDLKIVETAPGIKGATASAQRKPATLETGIVVQVPSFIEEGEVVRISTLDGSYLERAK
jgi:elongation factor P